MNVSLQYAAEHLADLISAADRGEDVEITRPEKPALKLIVSSARAEPMIPSTRRVLGAGRGELRVPSEEEWRAMDEQLAREMNDGPLFPQESE